LWLATANHNSAGNKTDYWLSRRLDYQVELQPEDGATEIDGQVTVAFRNGAPTEGFPEGIIGPHDERFTAGQNLSLLSLYSPLRPSGLRVDDKPVDLTPDVELDRYVVSGYLNMLSGSETTMAMRVSGRVAALPGGWYELHLVRQPTLAPDEVTISVRTPAGWEIVEVTGLDHAGRRQATGSFSLEEDRVVRVRVQPAGIGRLWRPLVEAD